MAGSQVLAYIIFSPANLIYVWYAHSALLDQLVNGFHSALSQFNAAANEIPSAKFESLSTVMMSFSFHKAHVHILKIHSFLASFRLWFGVHIRDRLKKSSEMEWAAKRCCYKCKFRVRNELMEKISDDKTLWRNRGIGGIGGTEERTKIVELKTQIDLMTDAKKCVSVRMLSPPLPHISPTITVPLRHTLCPPFSSATSNLFIALPVPTLEMKWKNKTIRPETNSTLTHETDKIWMILLSFDYIVESGSLTANGSLHTRQKTQSLRLIYDVNSRPHAHTRANIIAFFPSTSWRGAVV